MQKKLLRICIVLMIVAFVQIAICSADEIYMKNGEIITGEVISKNKLTTFIKTSTGSSTITNDDIAEIKYESLPETTETKAAEG